MISSVEIPFQHWTFSRSVVTLLIYEDNFAVHGSPVFLWDSFTSNLGDVGQQINSKVHERGKIFDIYIYIYICILQDRPEFVRKVTKID